MGVASKRKGSRIEREIVQLHRDIGVHAERDTTVMGPMWMFMRVARKRRHSPVRSRAGRMDLDSLRSKPGWPNSNVLFLKRNNATPLVVLPWRVWRSLLQRS